MVFRAAAFCGCSGASLYQGLAIYDLFASFALLAHVAELADAYGSGPYGATRGGSSPLVSMLFRLQTTRFQCRKISLRQTHCRFERCSDASLDAMIGRTKSSASGSTVIGAESSVVS